MTTRTYQAPLARPSGGPSSARWLALAVLCVSLLMVSLDNLVVNVALPTLVRDMHATSTELQWIVDAYVIVFAGLLRRPAGMLWLDDGCVSGCDSRSQVPLALDGD